MIVYLYGKDSYRRQAKFGELMAQLGKKKRLDVREVDFGEKPESWRDARDFLEQPSLFLSGDEAKTLVVRDHAMIEEAGEKEWAKTLKRFIDAPSTVIVISDGEKAPKKIFSFLIGKGVKSQEFREMDHAALGAFLAKEAAAKNIRFSPDAWRFFVSYAESGAEAVWRGMRGLELAACRRSGEPMSREEAGALFAHSPKEEMFALARALLAARGPAPRLAALERALAQKEAAAYFFNSLAYQGSGRDAFSLAEYDIRIKSGAADYDDSLTLFALSSK